MVKKIITEHEWKTEAECNDEQRIVDEKKKAKRKRPGRKGNPNFLPYDEAKAFIREEMLHSRGAYMEWWDRHKPKTISRFPYRVYKDWVSWNDFLGTNNKFTDNTRSWRPIEEAIVFVHKLGLKSQAEWMIYSKEGDKPADIPARPDIAYARWRTWNHWLGNKPQQAIEAKKEAEKIIVFYIAQYKDVPSNVFTFGIEHGGLSSLKERCAYEQANGRLFSIFKMFWYEPQKSEQIKQIVDNLSTPYYEDDRQRIASNINEIVWYLQFALEQISPQNMQR